MSMNREQFLATSGAEVHKFEFWLEQQWLIPEATDRAVAFTDRDVARARLIQELERDLGVNNEGIDIILHLLDQLHGMRSAFACVQAEFSERQSSPGSQVRAPDQD